MRERAVRRLVGLLRARLPELALEEVPDPRAREGRWRLAQILQAALLGLLAGCRSLAEAEALTANLARPMRRRLGLPRRLADTTARDALCRVPLEGLRAALHRLVRAAWRRKALTPQGLPFGVVAMDGKVTALPTLNHPLLQDQHPEGGLPYGLVRTVTAALVSAAGRPCIDVMPLPGHGNEASHFQAALAGVVAAHGGLFQVVSYDAGALSEANASAVIAAGKDYLFTLKGDQRTMYKLAEQLLDPHEVAAHTVDVLDNRTTVTRTLTLLGVDPSWSYDRSKGPEESVWARAGTFLRVEYLKRRGGEVVEQDARMFVTSPAARPAHAGAVVAAGAQPLGRREQRAPHARHGVCRGRPAVDRGRSARHARRARPAPHRLHAAHALPRGDAPLGRAARHPLECRHR